MPNQTPRSLRPSPFDESPSTVIEPKRVPFVEWYPDERTRQFNGRGDGAKIAWLTDIAGRDNCSSHGRILTFLTNNNNEYMLLFLGKHKHSTMKKQTIYNHTVAYFEAQGITYRNKGDIKNYFYGMEQNYSKVKKTYFTKSGFAKVDYENDPDKEAADKKFRETVEKVCPGFWVLQEARGDDLKMPIHQNAISDKGNIDQVVDDLDLPLPQKGGDDRNPTIFVDVSDDEESIGTDCYKDAEEEPAVLEMISNAIDYSGKQQLGTKRAFIKEELDLKKRELDLKARELDIREREVRLKEQELESAYYQQEKRARTRKMELEIRKLELESIQLERVLGLRRY